MSHTQMTAATTNAPVRAETGVQPEEWAAHTSGVTKTDLARYASKIAYRPGMGKVEIDRRIAAVRAAEVARNYRDSASAFIKQYSTPLEPETETAQPPPAPGQITAVAARP